MLHGRISVVSICASTYSSTKAEHMAGMELRYSYKAGRLDERHDDSVVAVVAVIGCQQHDTQTSEFLGMK